MFARTEALLDVAQPSARLNATGQSDLALLVLKAPPHSVDTSRSLAAVGLAGWQLHASSAATMAHTNSLATWLDPGR